MTGLEARFDVKRLIPSSRGIDHSDCRYFVLDPQHDIFALQALKYYARIVEKAEPELAKDLKEWTDRATEEDWVHNG